MCDQSFKARFAKGFILKFVRRLSENTRGAVAIEYGLIAALISVMVISGASKVGGNVNEMFSDVSSLLSGPPELPIANSRTE